MENGIGNRGSVVEKCEYKVVGFTINDCDEFRLINARFSIYPLFFGGARDLGLG